MNAEGKRPPKEQREVTVNVAGVFTGVILFASLIWSIYVGEMQFAYLNATLLAALAIANHLVNMMYK